MGTKNVRFTVDVEIDKDDWYGLQERGVIEDITPLEFMALLAGNVAEPNYDRTVKCDGLVGYDGQLLPAGAVE